MEKKELTIREIREQNRIRAARHYAKIKELKKEQKEIDYEKKLKDDKAAIIYINNFIQLKRILAPENIKKMFDDPNDVIKKIETAKQIKQNEEYSTNSKKSIYQTILYLIDNYFKDSISVKNKYLDEFEKYKMISNEQTEQNKKKPVYNFDSYLNEVEKKYTADSKEFIIASLFRMYGFRDNLKELKIIKDINESNDETKNYIYIDKNEIKIIMNNYKTKEKYKQQIINIKDPLKTHIYNYIKKNNLKYNDFLFGSSSLIKFIIKFNKDMGYDISINTYRHMLVSIEEPKTPAEYVKLSKIMNHSAETNKKYKQEVIK